ncbi:polysaccharide biosynthesis PFTS motif protein [Candidatus Methylopumilus planktonicus]|uniref:polysaccharide biosynthesis PFTS motif protein n=1 Tax=Candidatus Methylopumilus planktonicus TaxID=1581557 RepID=UPI003BEF2790
MMRGYRILKKSSRLPRIRLLTQSLINQQLTHCPNPFFLIKENETSVNEIVIRQYLHHRLVGEKLNLILLRSLANNHKVVYPLPIEWRKKLEEHGFSVGRYRTAVLWQMYILCMWLVGVYRLCKLFVKNLTIIDDNDYSQDYVFFASLSPSNISKNDVEISQFNIVTWWIQWSRNKGQIKSLFHTVSNRPAFILDNIKVQPVPHFLPKLKGVSLNAKYILRASYITLKAFINYIFGSWYNAFMLNQYADLIHAQLVNPKELAKEYFFHNSDWKYRPLWTYDVENNGAKVFMYFYSTNCEALKHKKNDGSYNINLYKGMTWSNYLVWDDYQAQFLLKSLDNNAKCEVAGPIWFSDSEKEVPQIPDNSVMIFDVEPFRTSVYQSYCFDIEYYVSDIAKQFILDIYDVLSSHDLNMVLKRKRHIGNKSSKSYTKILDDLEKQDNFITVDPEISAFRLIKTNTNLVISMPYTSTAQIAKSYGLLSIYYDPSGLLLKDDSISHGVPLISGKDELITWFQNYLKV